MVHLTCILSMTEIMEKLSIVCAFGGLRLGSREAEVENLGFTLQLWKN